MTKMITTAVFILCIQKRTHKYKAGRGECGQDEKKSLTDSLILPSPDKTPLAMERRGSSALVSPRCSEVSFRTSSYPHLVEGLPPPSKVWTLE